MKNIKLELFTLIFLLSSSTLARVENIYFRDMISSSDIIIEASIMKVEKKFRTKIAAAYVKRIIKGNPTDTVFFRASPSHIGDITNDVTDAKTGESGIYFLTKPNMIGKERKLIYAGKGRHVYEITNYDTLVNFQYGILYPFALVNVSIKDTIEQTNEYVFLKNSISNTLFIKTIKEMISNRLEPVPTHYYPRPDYCIKFFIEKDHVTNKQDLKTLYDGIPRIGNSCITLGFLFGTDKYRNAESEEVNKRLLKIFPDHIFVVENGLLHTIIPRNK